LTILMNVGLHEFYTQEAAPTSLGCPYPAPDVSLPEMHKEIRQLVINAFNSGVSSPRGALLMNGGFVTTRYDTDVEKVFRQESNFLYITGYDEPNATVIIDLASEETILFVPQRPIDYAIWNGEIEDPATIQAEYDFSQVLYQNQVSEVLNNLSGGNPNYPIYVMDELVQFPDQEKYTVNTDKLLDVVYTQRSYKTDSELQLMRYAANVSSGAHELAMNFTKPGLYEYNIEGRFLDGCFACGLMLQAYIPIVASGENSAVLHYNANDRLMENGDILLIDAGAEYHGYGTDITRTYPVNGVFTPEQAEVYNMVLEIQYRVISRVYPNMSLGTLQKYCIEYTCDHLTSYGFLSSGVSKCIDDRLYYYFFPHGVSHLIGIDVHDRGDPDSSMLHERMVITVEPGIYFNQALLDTAFEDSKIARYFVQSKIQPLLDQGFGGVRIEDVVVIWAKGPEVITTPPKSIFGIETQMSS